MALTRVVAKGLEIHCDYRCLNCSKNFVLLC
jgi:hypothetical protein